MVDRGRFDQAVNMVTVCDGHGKRFQENRADTFPRHKAITSLPKGAALPFGREHARKAKAYIFRWVQIQVDSAGDGLLALTGANRFAGQVNCRERSRASSVHWNARAVEVEEIGDPVGKRPRQGRRQGPRTTIVSRDERISVGRYTD